MEDIEHRAMPLILAVLSIALVTTLWISTAGYRDVAQHHWETSRMRVENQIISEKLEKCANNGSVPFNGALQTIAAGAAMNRLICWLIGHTWVVRRNLTTYCCRCNAQWKDVHK